MPFSESKLVPAAFWVGFVALGLATSLGGPNKRHSQRIAQPAGIPAATQALVAERDVKPAAAPIRH